MEPFNPCTHQTTVARLEWDTLTPAPAHCLVLPENGEHSARSELRKCANTLSQGTQHCLASPFPRNLFNPICAESCVQWLKHTIDVSIWGMVIRTNIIHMGTPYGLMLIHVYPHPLMFFFNQTWHMSPSCSASLSNENLSCPSWRSLRSVQSMDWAWGSNIT